MFGMALIAIFDFFLFWGPGNIYWYHGAGAIENTS